MKFRAVNKYHNEPCVVDGKRFDSRREARRYAELKVLERAGRVTDIRTQVPFELIPVQRALSNEVYKRGPHKGEPKPGCVVESAVKYVADFVYKTVDGKTVVEDVKGRRTKDYVIKRKLMLYIHHIKIKEIT